MPRRRERCVQLPEKFGLKTETNIILTCWRSNCPHSHPFVGTKPSVSAEENFNEAPPLDLGKRMLLDFPGCHCILASHSHFMVSDLNPQSSTLIQIKGTPNDKVSHRKSHLIEYDTYSWSAENILYEVFGMRTSRNYYFEQDLSELLKLISHKSSEINRIEELLTKFENIVFDQRDPLNDVIKSAISYIGKRND